jgi:superfamily I DNA/RNA helicase
MEEDTGNLVVDSVAGSGKTETTKQMILRVPEYLSVAYFAFNKHTADEYRPKASPNTKVMTTHSYGLKLITQAGICPGKYPKVDTNKVYLILDTMFKTGYLQLNEDQVRSVKSIAKKVISLLKANIFSATEKNIELIMDKHGYDDEQNIGLPILTDIIAKALEQSRIQTATIDYDDMLWYPVIYNIKANKYNQFNVVCGDEIQDFSLVQIELLLKARHASTRVLAVGDPNQSLYGFRGADVEAMPNVIKALNAKVLPLDITYRCDKAIVNMAKKYVPHIEAAPNAKEGEVINIKLDTITNHIKENDMVVCRYNSHLIKLAFKLIKNGQKAIIKGKDLGEGLISLINKIVKPGQSMEMFLQKLDAWRTKEIVKALESGKNPESINDKFDCIMAVAEECDSTICLKTKINNIFSDNNAPITLSSIHRAKGLEADRVFILKPSLMPSQYATQDWEKIQEKNCMYVAITRARHTLYMVE